MGMPFRFLLLTDTHAVRTLFLPFLSAEICGAAAEGAVPRRRGPAALRQPPPHFPGRLR